MSFITVSGLQNTGVDLSYASNELPVIGCADTGLQQNCNFVVTNSLDRIDSLMQKRQKSTVVATRSAFARYIWHDGIECYPVIHELAQYQFDTESASLQQLALALACHMGSPTIYLVGYQLDSEIETPFLQKILRLYTKTRFAFIRKPNPQKINVFNEYSNIVIEETTVFQELIKRVTG